MSGLSLSPLVFGCTLFIILFALPPCSSPTILIDESSFMPNYAPGDYDIAWSALGENKRRFLETFFTLAFYDHTCDEAEKNKIHVHVLVDILGFVF
jgi:hypothetical protein